jgi:hypothetical protein
MLLAILRIQPQARAAEIRAHRHALMAAILLRMARLDALDANAQAKPPDGEFA